MLVGPQKGQPVQKAKPIIKQQMIDAKEAIVYYEPEKQVRDPYRPVLDTQLSHILCHCRG